MESIIILIPIAIVIVSIAVVIFVWAVKNGQFEDLDTEGKRILFDNAPKSSSPVGAKKVSAESGECSPDRMEEQTKQE